MANFSLRCVFRPPKRVRFIYFFVLFFFYFLLAENKAKATHSFYACVRMTCLCIAAYKMCARWAGVRDGRQEGRQANLSLCECERDSKRTRERVMEPECEREYECA